jgi:hypothetical protein
VVVLLFTVTVVPSVPGVVVLAADEGLTVVGLMVKVRTLVTTTGTAVFVDGMTLADVATSTGGAFVGESIAAKSTFAVVGGLLVVPFTAILPFLVPFPTTVLPPIAPAANDPATIVPAANVPVAVFVPSVPVAVLPTTATVSGLLSTPGATESLSPVLCFDPASLSLLFFLFGFFMFLITFPVDFTGTRLLFIGMVAILGVTNTSVTVCTAVVDVS